MTTAFVNGLKSSGYRRSTHSVQFSHHSFLFSATAILFWLSALNVSMAAPKLKPVTVCEVLEDLPRYKDQTVAVVGRLSSNAFDGAWLSQGACNSTASPSKSTWPYSIFIGCLGSRPDAIPGNLDVDDEVLKAKIEILRRTTKLEYYNAIVIPKPGTQRKTIRLRETWSVVYGRIEELPAGAHQKAGLCAPQQSRIDIGEPESLQR